MTVGELIELLEAIADEHGDETEVRFAQQPSWPFENAIGGVVAVDEIHDERSGTDVTVAYIAEGKQLGYLPGAAKDALGW